MQVSTPAAPARGRARNNTRLHALAESCTRCLFRAKRPFAQWCVSPECKLGPDRDRRLDTGGAAQSATPHGRLKFSPRSRPNYLRKVTSEGRCSMGVCAAERFRRREVGIGRQISGNGARIRLPNPNNGHDRGQFEGAGGDPSHENFLRRTLLAEHIEVRFLGPLIGATARTPKGGARALDSADGIEHIVAASEAHDSGLCARDQGTRARFAQDLRNLTLASPRVNRHEKSGKDAGEWIPVQNRPGRSAPPTGAPATAPPRAAPERRSGRTGRRSEDQSWSSCLPTAVARPPRMAPSVPYRLCVASCTRPPVPLRPRQKWLRGPNPFIGPLVS